MTARKTPTSEITPQSTVCRTDDHLRASIDGSTILLHVERGKYFGFDGIGEAVWTAIAEPITVADLADRFAAEYDQPGDVIQRDLLVFLNRLQQLELVHVRHDERDAG